MADPAAIYEFLKHPQGGRGDGRNIPSSTQNPELQFPFPPLNGDNYPSWRDSIYWVLETNQKLMYIDSRINQPEFSDPSSDSWVHWENLVLSWIRRTLTPGIAKSIMHIQSAQNLWQELEYRYSQGKHVRVSDITLQMHSITQGDRSVSSYFTALKTLWEELESLRAVPTCSCTSLKQHKNNEYVICFLKGLNDIRSKKIIFAFDPLPHIDQVVSFVSQQIQEESGSVNQGKLYASSYSSEEIEEATQHFDDALIIGKGGYGRVYKRVLDDTVVAIKVVNPAVDNWIVQFHREVTVLSKIRHQNIIKLLGACQNFGCLVYEYMENGTLQDRLFQKDNTPPIPWKVRFKIASGIATGLHFLHETKPKPVVHGDLQLKHILLDRNYTSKIIDLGSATGKKNKNTVGTTGYISSEYRSSGVWSVQSDIYSLGVILLQIITQRHPVALKHLVQEAINKDKFPEMLDQNVTDWPLEDTVSYARLALKCCEMKSDERPNLASVILPELERLGNLGDNQP